MNTITGNFDLRQILQNVLIAGVTAGIMQGTGMANWGYGDTSVSVGLPEGGFSWAPGVAGVTEQGVVVGTVNHVTNLGQAAFGALAQGGMAAVISELTGGDTSQAFLMSFAMAMARAVASEMRVNQMHSSAASAVFCDGGVCRPNFTVNPNTGAIQLGGERINPGVLCKEQENCSVIGFDANGNDYLVTGTGADGKQINGISENLYSEIVRFEYNGGSLRGGDPNVLISLEDAINASGCALLGCSQSGTQGSFFGVSYDKGDPSAWNRFADATVEAFSGVHDFLNDYIGFGYGPTGLTSQNESWWTEVMSVTNIPLSSPLAFSNLVTPEMQYWIQNYYDNLEKK